MAAMATLRREGRRLLLSSASLNRANAARSALLPEEFCALSSRPISTQLVGSSMKIPKCIQRSTDGMKMIPAKSFSSLQSCTPLLGGLSISSSKRYASLDLRCSFSTGISNLPDIKDPDVKSAFKELLAWGWDDIPEKVIKDAKKAISISTEDKTGQQILKDVLRAAEASEDFIAVLVNIRMGLEELTGLTGENVTELPDNLVNAVTVAYKRYIAYVNSFGPNEAFLRKKVEAELGTRLIHLKQRVSGLGSEWGDINVIGTSGLSGSYVEQRA